MVPPLMTMIPLALLDPSPKNPRRKPSEARIQEMANSLKAKGQMMPIIVRKSPQDNGRYELVAGERRMHGANLNGWTHIAAVERELSDSDACILTISENEDREDLSPLEEARGYQNAIDTGLSAEEVAERLGVSLVTVNRRLRLLKLENRWLKALEQEGHPVSKWGSTLIEMITPLPKQMQIDVFQAIFPAQAWSRRPIPELPTAKQLQTYLNNEVLLDLTKAPFDKTDADLVPDAPACGDCPLRSAKQDDLFGSEHKGDHCLDGACFAKKLEATRAKALLAAKEKAGATGKLPILHPSYKSLNEERDHIEALVEAGEVAKDPLYPDDWKRVKKKDFDPAKHEQGIVLKNGVPEVVPFARVTHHPSGMTTVGKKKPKKKTAELPPKQQLAHKLATLEAKRKNWVLGVIHEAIYRHDHKGRGYESLGAVKVGDDLTLPEQIRLHLLGSMKANLSVRPGWTALLIARYGRADQDGSEIDMDPRVSDVDEHCFAPVACASLRSFIGIRVTSRNLDEAMSSWKQLAAWVEEFIPFNVMDWPDKIGGAPFYLDLVELVPFDLWRLASESIKAVPEPAATLKLRNQLAGKAKGDKAKAEVRKKAKEKAGKPAKEKKTPKPGGKAGKKPAKDKPTAKRKAKKGPKTT